ncbi:FliM/FliN family flagellar motor switch protein [Aquamicrobium sp. LC103]|uniref:FliM/FliN family flagellar motor switch protein n=1 Tax=Aquamicrobium sp. LC103 TaxID=1120658 RepID=UPI00063EAB4F|nr:FliM/FliN family flagellar motor switch protein [Aquamicrobium sp. LC103]TKT77474.1 flagellar motor switch protein FliM [Aquamicrobium sp. LC103]
MTGRAAAADTNSFIVERLVGDTGEPGHIIMAARSLAMRALPAIRQSLNEQLSYPIEIEVDTVELARLVDARRTGVTNDALAIASSATSPDALMLIADSHAVALLVSALFGGDPDMPVLPIERDLTNIELELATVVFEATAQALNGSGDRALSIRFPMQSAISGQELKKLVIRDGPAVRIAFSMTAPSGEGRFTVMMPQRVLLLHRSEDGSGQVDHAQEARWRTRFSEEVMRSSVRLDATIPLSRMTLDELSRLVVGQVIEFPESAQSRTRLSARKKSLFTCEFGKLGQNFTVRITEPFDEGQEFIDGLLPR